MTIKINQFDAPLSDLAPTSNNPRQISKKDLEILKKSMMEFPEMRQIREVVVDENMRILGGHQRVKALEALGEKSVPVKQVIGLTEEQKKEFIIKDNIANGEWDMDILANEWDDLPLDDWGLNVEWAEPEKDIIEDEVPEAPEEPKSKLGDIYQLGNHRLMCGDSTNDEHVLKLMGSDDKRDLADMVFTDPPWNVNYGAMKEDNPQGYKPRTILNDFMGTEDFKNFMYSAFNCMNKFSKEGAMTYVVMSAQEWGNMMLTLAQNQYHWSSTIIWNKDHLVLSRKDYHTKYEPIWYGWKEGEGRLHPVKDRKQSDVWDFDRPTKS